MLPDGLAAQPISPGTIDEVVALVRACEAHDSGAPMYERADLVGDLSLVDAQAASCLVRDAAGVPVGWGLVLGRRCFADVHPTARGRGIGGALVTWSVAVATAAGIDRIGQTIEDTRGDAVALLRSHGARAVRTSWILRRSHDPAGPAPLVGQARPGIEVRAARADEQDHALDLLERAFATWPDRPPSSRAAWRSMVTEREGFRADALQVAVEADGVLLGAMHLIDDGSELWVDKLGVDPPHQRRGVGRALLGQAFLIGHARGRPATVLSTDSNTGALEFYEGLGMVVTRSFTHWAIPLRLPG
ncbi:MAG: GNAT family N-acetyltransferase [Candidatus Nanopelagicales bacterium]|nr:GNAT family N-acetyltransferase [Candidatus Nanopelagicales bacterium]